MPPKLCIFLYAHPYDFLKYLVATKLLILVPPLGDMNTSKRMTRLESRLYYN